jgi:predicted O-linked N-acetylglucosamine transferase (SPINDLY family)
MKIKKKDNKGVSNNRKKKDAEYLYNLGYALQLKGYAKEAINYYLKALEINPNCAEAHFNLGLIHHDIGQINDAINYYQRYIQLNPNDADVYLNIGHALQWKGQIDQAKFHYMKALQLNPNDPEVHNNLGSLFLVKKQTDEAIAYFNKAIQLDPNFADAYYNLGNIFREQGNLARALENYQISVNKDSNSADKYNNLGLVLKDMGRLNEAEVCFKNALRIQPDNPSHYSNYLCSLNYSPQYDTTKIFYEHLQFAKRFSEPLSSSILPHSNMHIRNRRLNIGYVSPDFRKHPVAYFVEPILAEHDKEAFKIYCYSNSVIQDDVTDRLKSNIDKWIDITNMPDEKAAQLIIQDGIDILVDLAGHTANNCMLLFARKPAPVQVSWIGYLTTTGLSSIDYRIVDSYTDPPGLTEQFYTEQLMRLPESFLCYFPDREAPVVGRLPALTRKHVTFGSFNNLAKVSNEVISIWSKILKATPNSRLIMKTLSFRDEVTRQRILNIFRENNISEERIALLPPDLSPKHLESYNLLDLGLDTFPFNGLTTTCEAMWMGVPVVTLVGTAYHSRVGVSLLSNIGLPELVAKTSDEYISIAVNLANDLSRLQSLRDRLRDMMKDSPICEAKKFTANLEMCYRQMWETWCNSI